MRDYQSFAPKIKFSRGDFSSTYLIVIDESTELFKNRLGLQILVLEELEGGQTRLRDAVDGLHDRLHDEGMVLKQHHWIVSYKR